MKEFFWQYFTKSGSVDAYLMYKDGEEETAQHADMQAIEEPAAEMDTYH